MPYLIRTKNGSTATMRDGTKLGDPTKKVEPHYWQQFDNLPGGIPREGDATIDVREFTTDNEKAAIIAATAPVVDKESEDRRNYDARVRAKIQGWKDANAAAAAAPKPVPDEDTGPITVSLADVEGIKPDRRKDLDAEAEVEADAGELADETEPTTPEAPPPPPAKGKGKGKGK